MEGKIKTGSGIRGLESAWVRESVLKVQRISDHASFWAAPSDFLAALLCPLLINPRLSAPAQRENHDSKHEQH